jgi:hypothetical protein
MIARLQTNGVFAVHCTPNSDGFLCGVIFVSNNIKSKHLLLLNPETGEKYNVISPPSGYYTNYQLKIYDSTLQN